MQKQQGKESNKAEATIHADAVATLARLQATHPGLKKELEKSHAFAVFPSMGRAGIVLGGSYGKGEVFEQGKPIGFAKLSQMTLGVQVGGQTYSELVFFRRRGDLQRFKKGKMAFAANASAVIVKAAASGTTNPDGVTAHAYSRGGMLLEASLGGQKFTFLRPGELNAKQKEKQEKKAEKTEGGEEKHWWQRKSKGDEGDTEEREASGENAPEENRDEEGGEDEGGGLGHAGLEGARRVGGMVRRHPVRTALVGAGLTAAGLLLQRLFEEGSEDEDKEQPKPVRSAASRAAKGAGHVREHA